MWHFVTNSTGLKSVKLRMSSHFSESRDPSYINTTPRYCTWTSPPAAVYCRLQETLPWARHNTSIFLVLILVPSSSHAAENRSNACWRPCCEDPRMQHQFARAEQTVHPAVSNGETFVDASVTVYPIHIDQGLQIFWERPDKLLHNSSRARYLA